MVDSKAYLALCTVEDVVLAYGDVFYQKLYILYQNKGIDKKKPARPGSIPVVQVLEESSYEAPKDSDELIRERINFLILKSGNEIKTQIQRSGFFDKVNPEQLNLRMLCIDFVFREIVLALSKNTEQEKAILAQIEKRREEFSEWVEGKGDFGIEDQEGNPIRRELLFSVAQSDFGGRGGYRD